MRALWLAMPAFGPDEATYRCAPSQRMSDVLVRRASIGTPVDAHCWLAQSRR